MNKVVPEINPVHINLKDLKCLLEFIDEFEHRLWIDNVKLSYRAYGLLDEIDIKAKCIKKEIDKCIIT